MSCSVDTGCSAFAEHDNPRELVIMHRGLAPVLRALFLHVGEVLIEDDAVLASERDETLTPGAADQRQMSLTRQLHTPSGETRARDQDGNAHAYGLDHHLGGQSAGCVEDLVGCTYAMLEHPAGNLVDRIMAADVLHVDQR